MKKRWFLTLIASIPVAAAALAIQSCGGVGGTTAGNGGQGSASEEFLALLSPEQRTATSISAQECANCHGGSGPTDSIYTHWNDTVHASKGVTCESCHGPGSAHKANPTKENILTFPKLASAAVCGQCHGPINDQYNYSQHAKLIADPIEEALTDPARYGKTSRCVACHSGLTRAQYVDKGKDLGTLTDDEVRTLAEDTLNVVPHTADCTTCHNPHSKTGNLTANGEEAQLQHAVFNTDTTAIGAGTTPASFTTFNHLCAQCHNGRGTDPSDAKLATGTARPSMHDSNQMQMLMGFGGVEGTGPVQRNTAHSQAPGQCTKCHMPDSRHTFTVSFDKGCAPCHTASDAAARATSIKSEVLDELLVVKTRMEAWAKAKFGDSLYWEYTSTITGEGGTPPNQAEVPIEVKRARYNYYFVIRSGDYGVHNAPYAKHLLTVAMNNLDAIGAPLAQVKKMKAEDILQIMEGVRKRAQQLELQALD